MCTLQPVNSLLLPWKFSHILVCNGLLSHVIQKIGKWRHESCFFCILHQYIEPFQVMGVEWFLLSILYFLQWKLQCLWGDDVLSLQLFNGAPKIYFSKKCLSLNKLRNYNSNKILGNHATSRCRARLGAGAFSVAPVSTSNQPWGHSLRQRSLRP